MFSGCGEIIGVAKNKENREEMVRSGAHDASVFNAGMVDTSQPIEKVESEKQALEAFFKAKELLAKGHYSYYESEAKGNYAQAKVMFEKSIKFFIPDLQAMTFGKNPVHSSANWYFLRELHDCWGRACILSGHFSNVDKIEENAKDAWALAVIYEMNKNRSERERGEVAAQTFQMVKRGLVSRMPHSKRPLILDRSVSSKIKAEVTYDLPPIGQRHDGIIGAGKGGQDGRTSKLSRLFDSKTDRIRRDYEENKAQKLNGLKSARNLSEPHLFVGDPANGRAYSVRVQN